VSLTHVHFDGAAHFGANLRRHVVTFVSPGPITCQLAGKTVEHDAVDGSMAVLPAGLDTRADCDRDADSLMISVDPSRFALAAAEDCALDVRLTERLVGQDGSLLHLARLLASECSGGYPRGPLFWNETASRFVAQLVAGHTSGPKPTGGLLDAALLGRLRDYLVAHLDEPIDVATLARMTGRSQFHFSRVFRRAVGVSPYRYIVHLRLGRAVELVRKRQLGLGEIAARTGFADQSHLSRWVRRVYGVTPTQLVA
jgi:AraC family transcriptional regulator